MVYGNTIFFLSIEHFITGFISLRFMIRLPSGNLSSSYLKMAIYRGFSH